MSNNAKNTMKHSETPPKHVLILNNLLAMVRCLGPQAPHLPRTQLTLLVHCAMLWSPAMYTWHTLLHYPHGANAGCDLAGVAPVSWTTYTVYNFADDLHWPELGILLESIHYHEAARKASFLGSMCENSLMAAIDFERRFDALMKYVINSQEQPIGKGKDFIYRVEFKTRGSCHYLVTAYFFWIENIPQDISCDTRDVLVQYINSVIKTDIPDESDVELYQLVKRLQTHSHSKYFRKTPPSFGRFKFHFVLQTI